jgi:hypothetical protein
VVVTFTAFSFMSGIIHPYYTVALAPAVAALVATGAVDLWRLRSARWALPVLAVVVAVSTAWSVVLLSRSADFVAWGRWVVLVAGALAVAGFVAAAFVRGPASGPLAGSLRQAGAVAAAIAVLAGPAAYSLQTAATAHTGAIVSAGPTVSSGFSVAGGMPGTRGGGQFSGMFAQGGAGGQTGQRTFGPPTGTGGTTGSAGTGLGTRSARGGGAGGLLGASTPGAALTALLEADAGSYSWVAATTGSNNAAGYQLATQEPVMAVGGFNGTDPAPTLAQFQAHVAAGDIHYYVESSSMASTTSGGSDDANEISEWVAANFTPTTVDGTTVYDLTAS